MVFALWNLIRQDEILSGRTLLATFGPADSPLYGRCGEGDHAGALFATVLHKT